MKSLLLVPVLLFAVSCGKSSGNGSHKKVSQVFVKGNPLVMVDGTTKNKTPFITAANYTDFNGYAMTNLYIFTEKELLTEEESDDIEAGQEAEESDQTQVVQPTYSMKRKSTNSFAFEDQKGSISIGFYNSGSALALETLKLGDATFDASIEHYSVSPDKSKLSFLMKLHTSFDGDVLVSATFYKESAKASIPKVSTEYHYLYGKGVVVPWKLDATRKVTLEVCPSMTEYRSFTDVKAAAEKWETPFLFKTQKLDIEVKQLTSCKPFSDVNEHAIHYVDSYLTMPDKDAYNPGFTLVHSDLSLGNIFDADILILGAEIRKDPNYQTTQSNRTLTHEMGHFLGLDHQFDGTYSIMSYDRVYSLGMYDYNAITNLYP